MRSETEKEVINSKSRMRRKATQGDGRRHLDRRENSSPDESKTGAAAAAS